MTHLSRSAFVALLAVTLLIGLVPLSNPVAQTASAQFKLEAPDVVDVGEPIDLRLSVAGASGVGGYEAVLRFDRRVAEFSGVSHRGNDVAASGRGIAALGPVEHDQGESFGFYSCPVADCADTASSRAGAGPSGNVYLGTAKVIARQPGLLEIALGPASLVDSAGRLINTGQAPAVVINVGDVETTSGVGAPPATEGFGQPDQDVAPAARSGTDLTGDGRTDNGDAREAAFHWSGAQSDDGCGTGSADIDGDGCVNVDDIQAIASSYSSAPPAAIDTGFASAALIIAPEDFVPTATWTVNTTSDAPDANVGNGVCATAAGQCSLRAAIENANVHSGNDLINFNIPGTGVQTIGLTDRLPNISDGSGGVMIDGYTQPGASPNTSALASNAVLRIAIEGIGEEIELPAFFITSHGNIFQGLAVYDTWRKFWMNGPGAYDNLIAGNFIGTDPSADFESPNFIGPSLGSVVMDSGAHDNQVGDRTLAGRNIISAGPRSGINITQEDTSNNVVVNNIIGLSPDGQSRLSNATHGVDIDQGASDNTVGGLGALERNVISGNSNIGVEITHELTTTGNQVIGNFIGTDLTGNTSPAFARNTNEGIHIDDGPGATVITDNVIGGNGLSGILIEGYDTRDTIIARNRIGVSLNGTAIPNGVVGIGVTYRAYRTTIGPDNIIANHPVGIRMDVERENIQNRITRNSIYDNGFGIDLHPYGVTPNGQYPTTGPNLRLPFPALSSASPSTVTGRACAGCTVEVFLADGGDNEYGQGRTFVGSAVATPDLTGAAVGSFTATVSGLAVGNYVTATATDANGNSSEFALDRQVTASGLTPAGALVARDTFERNHVDTWGTALRGGPWTLPFLPLSDYNMSGGRATINLQAANTTRMSLLPSVSERDIDATVQVSTNKVAAGSNQFAYLVLRRKDNGNQFHARLRFATNGAVYVQATRVLNQSEAGIGSEVQVPGLTHTANQRIWLRAQAVGASPTTIRIKAWLDGNLEPTAWNYTNSTNTDAVLQTAGGVGVRAFLASTVSNAPVTISFDGFRANAPAPADAVAPAAPTGLVAAPGNNAVYLGWSPNSEADLVGYHVYRSTSTPVSTATAPVSGTEPVTTTSFVDSTALNGIPYFYVVTAVDASTNRSGPSNQVTATPDPAAGSALDFDGVNDHVTFGPAADAGVTNFTIEAWFRRDGTGVPVATSGGTGGVTAIPILTKGGSEEDGSNLDMNYFLGIRSSDNVLAADFEDNATGANHAVTGTTPISLGVWHHAAVTFDGSTWRLYLNGVLDATLNIGNFTPRSDSIQHAALATTINSTGVVTGFFDGRIDEARVWNVARSQGQIATARDLQLTSGQGLVARWGMNEGSGNVVLNSIDGGSNGTASGGPIWVPGAPFAAGTDPAPSAPTGLDAQPGPGRIDLDWNNNSEPDIAGYNIYRDSVVGGSTVQVVAAGDIASCSSSGDEATAALVNTLPGDVLALGDNVYEDGTLTEFNNCYQPTWGAAKARTRPAAGNHEYQTANASGYFSYFGAAAGTVGQGYYSYDYGTWHIIVLNSNCSNVSCSVGSAQEQWLRADLAANDEQCTLATYHHPRFSSGNSHGNDTSVAPLFQALYDYNADVILNGHDHTYERFAKQSPTAAADPQRGIRQFVVGTGGRSHNGFDSPEPNSQVRNADTYGVLQMDLRPGGYSWDFVPEAGRTFTDSGSDVCHDANGPVSGSGAPINGSPVASSSYSDTSVTPGVEYNYTVTAVDAAGHESDPSNAVSETPDPSINNALDFDGTNDHVTLGAASALNSNTFTIETWFRRDGTGVATGTSGSAPGLVSAIPLVTKGRTGGSAQIVNWFLGIDTATNRIAADFETAADDVNHGIIGTTTLATGTWYHAAATYDGTTFRVYLNGVQEASVAVADGPGTGSTHPAALGTALDTTGAPAGFFNGVLDEARVWNVARSAAQIFAGATQELTSGTGLTARYGMNEGSGTAIGNSVAGGVSGTAVNGPTWVGGSPFTLPDNPPSAPTGLVASPGNNSVGLSWAANAEPDIAGYRVYRGTSLPVSTAGSPISGASLLTSPNYLDTSATNGTTYHYVVTAIDLGDNISPPSASATATPSASAGGALDFDGTNDHVTLGPASGLNSNTFTIETWFRRDGTGIMAATTSGAGGVSAAPLMAKGLSGGGVINWFMGVTADGFLAVDFESASDDSNHAVIGSTALSNGTWYHAAATYDGSILRLYLNGAQQGSTNVANGPGAGSNHPPSLATAMTPAGVATGFFNGVLDEARVWNVARSAADIAAGMSQELTSGAGLIARYGMNEGTGTAVANSVAGGPAGIAVNGPAWVPGAPFTGGGGNEPPAAPNGLNATPGNNSVFLNWNANTEPDLAGYNVYRDGAPSGTTVQSVGAGDIASCSSSGDEATAALIDSISGDVLALGDTVYESGTPTEYTNCYDPSWGRHKARTHPVVGNHEYGTANASGYFNYYGSIAGTPGQGYYSYDYGEWHIVVLNSMCANVGGCGVGSAQYNWLVGDLAANDESCTMALWHHPRFSSAASHGSDPITQPLYQALYDANADLILTGHDHSYERFAPQTAAGALDLNRGIRQFVVGTGGRSHYAQGTLRPNSEVYNGDTYGVIKLQLKPTSYDWEFVPEAGRTFTDTGTQSCHDANGLLASSAPLNGTTPVTGTSYVDTTAVNGTTYNYVVTAVDDGGEESPASASDSATPSGSAGNALDFDGVDDHVTFGNAASLAVTNFTIETWFRRDGTGTTTQTSGGTGGVTSVVPLVTRGASESDSPANLNMNYFLGFRTTDNVLVADFEDTVNGGNHAVTGLTPITSGVWHHAAVTYNTATDTWNLYLDGVLDRTLTIGDFTPESTSIQHAGLATAMNSTGVQAGRFDGALDEVRIWNVARTGADISASWNQPLTSGTGLIARWGLDEGTAASVGNSVAGGVNGTAVNGPLWVAGAPFAGGGNQAPVFSTDITDQSNSEGNVVSLDADATDPNPADTLVYSATNLPNGVAINSSTGVISGTLSGTSAGTYAVTVAVSDGSLTDTDTFTWTVTEPSTGSALDFDGVNDHVTLGPAATFNDNTFTVETWFRRDGTGVPVLTASTGGLNAIPLVTKGRSGSGNINWFLGIDSATNRIAADFESSTDDSNHPIIGTTTLVNGTWYHAAITYSGGNFRLYLNGVEETFVAVANGPETTSTLPPALGTAMDPAGTPAGFFNGVLDEVRIWDFNRSAAQILASRDLELTSGTGLVARYGMNEGSGTTVANSVAGGVNGTAVNGPLWVAGAPFAGGGNQAPVFSTDITDQSNSEGNVVSLDADATDPNPADTLVYSATNLPNGVAINSSTGVISGTLSGTSAGVYSVTITVSDGSLTDTDTFTWTVSEPGGGATGLDFDGTNDHVTLGAASALNSNTFTIETWFRRDGTGVATGTSGSAPGLVSAIPLVTKGRTGGSAQIVNWFLGIDTATNRIAADFETAADDVNHGIIGTTTLATGTWYHAAATYDGTTFRVYLNGVQEASVAVAAGPGTGSTHPAALGTALDTTGAPAGFFNGVLDEARVWNVARSAAQIFAGVSQELTSGTGLTARYGMNEGAGTAVANSIAGGPAGTAVGGPLWVAGSPFTPPPPPNDPPAAPAQPSPPDDAIGVATDAQLSVQVTDPESGALSTTFYGRPVTAETAPDFTIVALPDTQHYVDNNGANLAHFEGQTQWIVQQQSARNIVFVTHLGDVVENRDSFEVEWQRASAAMATLDQAGVPNNLTTGNHDVNQTTGNGSFYDQYFPPSRYDQNSWYGGYLGQLVGDPVDRQNKNNYELFSVGSLDFIILHLEYDLPGFALDWAEDILDQYPDRMAIVTTHLFVNTSSQRGTSPLARTDGTSAEAAWQRLRTHCNLFMILNGHYPGEGRRTDNNACGDPVHQLLSDYQERTNGGDGWLRIMNFKPSEDRIDVQTYSPTIAGGPQFETDASSQFSLDVDLAGGAAFEEIATVSGTPSGGTASTQWAGLAGSTEYEWYAVAGDGNATTTGPIWSFTTEADATEPAAPSGLIATPGAGNVTLDWTANTEPDLVGYNVYRSLTSPVSTAGTPLNGLTPVATNTYVDTTVSGGNEYFYVVTAVDSSDNELLVSNEDSATPTVPPSMALDFDGVDDRVTFGTASALGLSTFTIETWFRRDGAGIATSTGTGGITNAIPLVTKGRGEGDQSNVDANWFLGIDATSGVLVADFEDMETPTGTNNNHPVTGITAIPISATTWHHAAVTYSAATDTWNLYLNGNLERTLALGGNFTPRFDSIQHAGLATAMTSAGAQAGFFNGALDEVRIWNMARTQAQIAATMDNTLTGGTGLVARYALDEGTGTTTSSSIAGAPLGTLVNGPLWVVGAPITSAGPNQAPVFTTDLGNLTLNEGQPVNLDADATDPDGDGLIYSASPLPTGISIDPLTGIISGTLLDGSAGVYNVTVAVNDGALSDMDFFDLTVNDVDAPPAAPTGLNASAGNGSVALSWTANGEPDLAGYRVFRSTTLPVSTTGDGLGGATLISGTSYTDLTAVNGTAYNYVVIAVDAIGGRSAASNNASATPAPNMALDFDGTNDHVTFGAAPNLGVQSFTIETWFRRDGAGSIASTGTGGVTNAIPLVSKGRSQADTPANLNANYFLGIDATTGTLVADFEDTATGGNHPVTGITAIPISATTWHHAAVTYDTATDTWNLYLNGNLERTLAIGNFTPESASIQHAALATAIDSTGTLAGFFNGVLDEVRIWNVARSQAQIQASKDLELTSGTGLIARYGLTEGTGTTVNNTAASAPANTNGTAVGGPPWVSGFVPPVVDTTPPPVPSGLAAAPGTNLVSLTWNAVSAPDLAGYRVFRGTSLPVDTTGNGLGGAALHHRHQLHRPDRRQRHRLPVRGHRRRHEHKPLRGLIRGERHAIRCRWRGSRSRRHQRLHHLRHGIPFAERDQLHARDLVPARWRGRRRDHRHRWHRERPAARDQGRRRGRGPAEHD